jgi:hypothetical protein
MPFFRAKLARSAGLSLAGRGYAVWRQGRAHDALAVGLHRCENDLADAAIEIGLVNWTEALGEVPGI